MTEPTPQQLQEKANELLQQGKSEVEEAEKEPEGEEPEEEESEEEHPEDEQKGVSSVMLSEWGYNRQDEVLEVVFMNGREESYPCSVAQWEDAQNAASVGKYMWANFL